jgi:hypothetical protein
MDNHERILGSACGWVSLLTMASDAAMGKVAGKEAFEDKRLPNSDCRSAIAMRSEITPVRDD